MESEQCVVCRKQTHYHDRLLLREPLTLVQQQGVSLHRRCGTRLSCAIVTALCDTAEQGELVLPLVVPEPRSRLSRRQRDVWKGICRGLSNKQISEETGLAEKTVKNYCALLYKKLGAGNRAEAAVFGFAAMLDERESLEACRAISFYDSNSPRPE